MEGRIEGGMKEGLEGGWDIRGKKGQKERKR